MPTTSSASRMRKIDGGLSSYVVLAGNAFESKIK